MVFWLADNKSMNRWSTKNFPSSTGR